MLLKSTSNEGLLSRIQEYAQSDEAVHNLELDIHQRLGYSFEPYCYRVGSPINQGFGPSDRVELLKLQAAGSAELMPRWRCLRSCVEMIANSRN